MFYQSSVARLNNFLRKPDCPPPSAFSFPIHFIPGKTSHLHLFPPHLFVFPCLLVELGSVFSLYSLLCIHPFLSIQHCRRFHLIPPPPLRLFVYFASFCLFFTFVCTCVCVRQSITPLQFIIILSTAPSNWILSQSHLTSRQAGMGGKTGAFSLHLAQPLVSTSINSCKVVLRPVRFLFSLTLADITLGFYKRLMCTEE